MSGESDARQSRISKPVDVRRLSARGQTIKLNANEEQRSWLAKDQGLVSVEAFATEAIVKPWKSDGAAITGRVKASFTQACVVTLEPVAAEIEEKFELYFLPEQMVSKVPDGGDIEFLFDPDAPEEPESFDGRTIDVGAVIIEQFSLAIDPYPRKPGSEVPDEFGAKNDAETAEKQRSPFAALAALKTNDNNTP